MIHQIMVIAESGINLFNHEFTRSRIDPTLFGGFTTALNNFSHELMENDQNIESVNMSRLKLVISFFKHFYITLVINKYDVISEFQPMIVELQNCFLEKYGHLEEMEWNQISLFEGFTQITHELCKSQVNIAVISLQSQLKMEFWNYLSQLNQPNHLDWNTVQMRCNSITNCNVSIWNLDLVKNALTSDYYQKLLEDKPLVIVLIEPNLNRVLEVLPFIVDFKRIYREKEIYGIICKGYGPMLKNNCEVLLKIPVIELDLKSPQAASEIEAFISDIVIGKWS